MQILVVGGGGREHAIAWKLSQSRGVTLHAAPGNAGLAEIASCHPVAATDLDGQVRLARELGVQFVVVGPDDPLAMGLVDALAAAGIPAFGPNRAAARLESSKVFAKEIMAAANIPTPASAVFSEAAAALDYIKAHDGPLVVKADGLALGKGAFVCGHAGEARAAIHDLMVARRLGAAGDRVLIEERLTGPECTVLALCDGKNFVTLPPSQDHKRIGAGDTGPNTGGMGAYSPVPGFTGDLARAAADQIIGPTLEVMAARGTPFRGCLYAGLMLTPRGPQVLEYNARFGDPEAQAILPLLDADLLEILMACSAGSLDAAGSLPVGAAASACVVVASGGYPGDYAKGKVIQGLAAARDTGALVFHAGTAGDQGRVVTAGGRVLSVVATAENLRTALAQAYAGVQEISFEKMYFRPDIGWRALAGQ